MDAVVKIKSRRRSKIIRYMSDLLLLGVAHIHLISVSGFVPQKNRYHYFSNIQQCEHNDMTSSPSSLILPPKLSTIQSITTFLLMSSSNSDSFSDNDEDDNDGEEKEEDDDDDDVDDTIRSNLNEMRLILEGSWNADTMGAIPNTPETAANEAGGSLLTAKDRGLSLFIINLLLPSYDITQGSSYYDEVEAVSFCIALSQMLKGKSSIVVRDSKTVQTVTRVLKAREKTTTSVKSPNSIAGNNSLIDKEDDDDAEDDDDGQDKIKDDNDNTSSDKGDKDNIDEEMYSDFGGFGTIGDAKLGDSKKSKLVDFRKQLMSDWGDDDSINTKSLGNRDDTRFAIAKPGAKNYRLTSMLGDNTFSRGPDMFDKVIKAVSANGQPKEDEDTIIILSAVSEEETIGVRALVSKYQQTKTIVLINCSIEPTPRELIKAETIYSLLPLIAKPADADNTGLLQPKVVVMRRFPRDFEVFMDFGNGFELTETVAPSGIGRKGPTMQWIAEKVKRQMDARA